ncbi:MAG TPA: ATP-binding protein [Longimicrobium sp.]|nr:ATP-binding protein [Longimicrobium sp.]
MSNLQPTSTDAAIRSPRRLQAVRETGLLDTPPEPAYDRLAALAARVLHAPMALVSLVDENRQFFKSSVGLPEPVASARETPLSHSFCKHTLVTRRPFVVDDARTHELVRDNLATTELGIGAYLGIPLFAQHEPIGTLCVLAAEPRHWTEDEIDLLGGLATAVQGQVELRQEIFHLREAQRALQEAEERYRSLVEELPVIVYVAEPQPPYAAIYVSPTIATLGYAVDEWLLSPDLWIRVLHPDDRDWVLARTQAAFAAGEATDAEYRVVGRDGGVRWLHDRGRFVRDSTGRALYWQGLMVDTTERKEAEEALQDQRRQLRQMIDVVPHLLFVKDEEGRYIVGNQAMALACGTTPEELVGKTDQELGVNTPEAERHRLDDLDVMRTGEPKFMPADSRTGPDGVHRIHETLKVPFRRTGTDQPAVLGLVRDITEEQQKSRQLRRAERLASVGTLVGGVAHELNNPLSAIKGLSHLMLMDPHSVEDHENLETIHREADRMARIVADLRRLARQSLEQDALPRTSVDLNEVVRHVLRVRRYSLTTRNVDIVEELNPDLGRVLADTGRLEQVVLNLVLNAEQAIAGGAGTGTVTIRTHSDRGTVSLSVQDTGPGIAQTDLERIFDPFWTTKPPGEGTGLGLSLVHGIVAEHGGEIRVESELGSGARFTLVLPLAPGGAPAAVPAAAGYPPALAARRTLRILVVDDEEAVRRMLVRYLRKRGHGVDEAAEGTAALACIEEAGRGGAEYDVILSDLRMPGLGGAQLLERLRGQGNGLDRRLIFLTGDAASPDAERLLAECGVPVVVKPFEFALVEALIDRIAAGADEGTAALGRVGTLLHARSDRVRLRLVDRLRSDPGIPNVGSLGDADLEVHTCTLVACLAQALVIPNGALVDGTRLLQDGTEILRLASKLHGDQRARLGWTADSVSREFVMLEEEIGAVLREPSPHVLQSDVEAALHALAPSLATARRTSLAMLTVPPV